MFRTKEQSPEQLPAYGLRTKMALAMSGLALIAASPAEANSQLAEGERIEYTGHGDYDEFCKKDQAPYIHWILTAGGGKSSVSAATLEADGSYVVDFSRVGKGAFHAYTDFSILNDSSSITALTNGETGPGEIILTKSDGCKNPYEQSDSVPETPVEEDESVVEEPDTPVAEDESVVEEPDTPVAEDESVVEEPDTPVAEDESVVEEPELLPISYRFEKGCITPEEGFYTIEVTNDGDNVYVGTAAPHGGPDPTSDEFNPDVVYTLEVEPGENDEITIPMTEAAFYEYTDTASDDVREIYGSEIDYTACAIPSETELDDSTPDDDDDDEEEAVTPPTSDVITESEQLPETGINIFGLIAAGLGIAAVGRRATKYQTEGAKR